MNYILENMAAAYKGPGQKNFIFNLAPLRI